MTIDPLLIERIYEAAALPELWPGVLESIADSHGAFGATILANHGDRVTIMSTPRIERIVADYIAGGWAADPTYAAPLLADLYPGFRAVTHYRTIEEIERLPVHAEFFAPRGLIAGIGTVLQGTLDDSVQLAIEGFPTYRAAEQAVAPLDLLRAPLGRALSLTARVQAMKTDSTVTTLDLAGVPAAVVGRGGDLRAANDRFVARLGGRIATARGRLRFADRFVQTQLDEALAELGDRVVSRSIAVPRHQDEAPVAFHLLPLRRAARDLFEADGVLILLADAANASIPGADLLRLLFDLTPAEARLARHLLEGRTPAEAARALGVTDHTARTHLRRVFAKTGVTRQAELVRLLLGLGAPV